MQHNNHNCREELKDAALKVTPARLGVLEALEHAVEPLDVATITTYLENHTIKADPATVFRIMNSFTQKGLAKSIQLQEGKMRYEHAGKADHHHLVCMRCGAIQDISDCNIAVLEKDIKEKKRFHVLRHSLEFFGICADCQP